MSTKIRWKKNWHVTINQYQAYFHHLFGQHTHAVATPRPIIIPPPPLLASISSTGRNASSSSYSRQHSRHIISPASPSQQQQLKLPLNNTVRTNIPLEDDKSVLSAPPIPLTPKNNVGQDLEVMTKQRRNAEKREN
mmetsp:Transcript_14761/g.26798  ORF Transcript_14761/g.26798 Transcript_14761/m.26798 type:complete len:136 (-) Transcript_14761:80-487(-)